MSIYQIVSESEFGTKNPDYEIVKNRLLTEKNGDFVRATLMNPGEKAVNLKFTKIKLWHKYDHKIFIEGTVLVNADDNYLTIPERLLVRDQVRAVGYKLELLENAPANSYVVLRRNYRVTKSEGWEYRVADFVNNRPSGYLGDPPCVELDGKKFSSAESIINYIENSDSYEFALERLEFGQVLFK